MENESYRITNDSIHDSHKANDTESSDSQKKYKENSHWKHLINLSNPHIPEESSSILETMQSIAHLYESDVGSYLQKNVVNEFKSLPGISYLNIPIEKIFQKIQNDEKYFYFNRLIHIFLTNILNQYKLSVKLNELVEFDYSNIDNYLSTRYHYINDSINYSDIAYSSSIVVDKKFNFFIKLKFNDKLSKEVLDHGKSILEKNYSKFISGIADSERDNIIYIPFYPMGSITNLFYQTDHQVKLTLVDKIVIILEIATALKDLHDKNEYHGSLNGKYILLNSMKDAYISFCFYDKKDEKCSSQLKGQIYYRSPDDFYQCVNDATKRKQLKDIFSFGVLIDEIISQIKPEVRFNKLSRDQRTNILSGKYFDFLFKNEEKETFKDDLKLFKDIIQECMKNDENKTMDHIIRLIKKLPVYIKNKDEIELRLKIAESGANYRCSFADVVEGDLFGFKESTNIIIKLLDLNEESIIYEQKYEDIIKKILEKFHDNVDDYSFYFEDIFELIILNHEEKFLENESTTTSSNNKKLYQFSMKSNNKAYFGNNYQIDFDTYESECISIFPFSSLEKFTKLSQNRSLIYVYLIAMEMEYIHSYGLYHGELSNESIGIYYNRETKSFVPSIVPYYQYYCNTNKNKNKKSLKKKHQFDVSIDILQEKDLRQFKKIITNTQHFDLPQEVIDRIRDSNSFNDALYEIHNYIIEYESDEFKNALNEETRNYQYSSFIISYSSLMKMGNCNEIILNRIGSVLNDINTFMTECFLNSNNTIGNIMMKIQPGNKIDNFNYNSIKEIIQSIQMKCFKLYNKIADYCHDYSDINVSPNEIINEIQQKQLDLPAFNIIRRKVEKVHRPWFYKFSYRRIEIIELSMASARFIMRRYLCNLNPKINYQITVKLINKTYSIYQDFPIKAEDIINISNELGFNDVAIKDGNIIITIQPNHS